MGKKGHFRNAIRNFALLRDKKLIKFGIENDNSTKIK